MKSILAILSMVIVMTGCQTVEPKRVVVEPGFRDYAIVTYHPKFDQASEKDRLLIRLELNGSGLLTSIQGRSSRVRSSWWSDSDKDNWDDYASDRLFINAEDLKDTLQSIADLGILDRKRQGDHRTDALSPYLVLQVRIGKKSGLLMTDSAEAMTIYNELYTRFSQ